MVAFWRGVDRICEKECRVSRALMVGGENGGGYVLSISSVGAAQSRLGQKIGRDMLQIEWFCGGFACSKSHSVI